jgi:hypothetical protein
VTCFSNPGKGSKEGAIFGANQTLTLCADGENGCCTRAESVPGANGKHQPVNLKQNRPSRTAVDFNGDVWIANRAHDPVALQSSVTKIANSISDCVERNGIAGIQTSSDVNNDGIITTDCDNNSVPDDGSTTGCAAQEFWGYDDECILFTVNTGPVGQYGRPLTLGPGSTDFGPADAWAGTFVDGKFYRIDGATGAIKTVVTIAPQGGVTPRPYGAAIDQFGILWAPNIGSDGCAGAGGCSPAGAAFYFDTNNPVNQGLLRVPSTFAAGGGFYGIALDGYKDGANQLVQQVWFGAVYAEGYGAYRFRPVRNAGFAGIQNGKWARGLVRGVGEVTQGRGLGVDNRTFMMVDPNTGVMRDSAFVWVAMDGSGIAKIPTLLQDDMTTTFGTATNLFRTNVGAIPGTGTLGAGVAVDLDIWGINQGSSSMTHFKVDAAGAVLNAANPDQVPLDDRPAAAENACPTPMRGQCKPHPYTYSDFTGFGLRNFTNPRGTYTFRQEGCGAGKSKWLKVIWDADTPPGTSISMRARSADDVSSLAQATWYGTFGTSPADLSMTPGPILPNPSGFLEVEFILTTVDKASTPALKSFQIVWVCGGLG